MSKEFEYTITGTTDLANELSHWGELKHVREAVKLNGSEMQQSAVRYSPYDTGFLARSIELGLEDHGMTARVYPTAEYAVFQEYGTRYQSGTPFMRPAFFRQVSIFIDDMSRFGK